MIEKWASIRHGYYEISNLGRFRRVKSGAGTIAGRLLKPVVRSDGYFQITTSYHGRHVIYLIHWLVATSFIGARPKGKIVHHKDHNPSNNRWDNLEYKTRKRHTRHHAPKLNKHKVCKIKKLWVTGKYTQVYLGKKFGVHSGTICRIVSGERWGK